MWSPGSDRSSIGSKKLRKMVVVSGLRPSRLYQCIWHGWLFTGNVYWHQTNESQGMRMTGGSTQQKLLQNKMRPEVDWDQAACLSSLYYIYYNIRLF